MKLDILFLNDVHAYLEPHNELFYSGKKEIIQTAGGYSRLYTKVENIRAQNPNTLLFDGGDTFHGTLPIVESKGEAMIPILNKFNFSAMTAHWDFGYGPEQLKILASQITYPILAINIYNEDDSLFFKPYIIIKVENFRIAVIGICSNIIDKTMPDRFSEGIRVTDGADELPYYIDEVKNAGVDFIILLSHNGFPQDVELIKNNSGIDLCLSAHTHNRIYEPVKIADCIVVQCGCHGSFLGQIQFEFTDKTITMGDYKLIQIDESIEKNIEIENIIKNTLAPYEYLNENIVGKTPIILHRYNTLNSSMDNLLLASIKYITQTEIAFLNGWRYGAPIAAGNITEMELYNIIPMNPPLETVELTGSEIIEMLEENLERTFSSRPMQQMGGYVKRCLGITINMRIENPEGSRIQEIYFGNEHLENNRIYKVSFVTSQGVPKKYDRERRKIEIKAVEAMKIFLKENPDFDFSDYNVFYLV
ncbi:MAG: bifunctional metallophosphatase/5'-nucleotidase [Ignavibacteriaceae bacterium]|jgi:5'-nucleotidase|nr:bifunctional metallophosphatase/5'-nucleotidase [Ignavibacteriaceae bacterium]